ncbi:hypothetical protein QZH41_010576 [Actinostola sp. cb2023]|nr:hypothetical protein QZH41_010576 [Actinostola sp. cb2023]
MAAALVEFNRPFDLENEQDVSFFFHSGKEDVVDSETMDIWKKFELLPTPPRSPSRNSDSPVPMNSLVADTLQIVSEILDEDETPPQLTPVQSDKNPCSLRSKLIQDCMWNSLAYESIELKVLTCPEDLYETPCSTPPPVEYVSSDCVDPANVFPYPINDNQSFCSSHTSDSEEEIDVVTIERPKRRLSTSSETSSDEPSVKRQKPVASRPKSFSLHKKSKEVKRQESSGSDEEDGENKRAVHNVLERKRRNDLKTSFHQLRAEVPEIEDNERSPKVVILRKAKDYIEQLKTDEARLRREMDKENKKNKELTNKLSALRCRRN